nr:MAG TPA: hypothetical protein [Caudoviricetes sp.]
MLKQPWLSFSLGGVSLTEFGLEIPSPLTSLSLNNSQISSMTSWTLTVNVGGDDRRKINISAFEALLYSSAQSSSYAKASGIPVSFGLGWLDDKGNIAEHLTYQGFTLTFKVSTTGQYMTYTITGYASLAIQTSIPVIRVPAITGIIQPSAVVEELAKAVKATSYYELDIDHNDTPTLISHGSLTTSFNKYVRGSYSANDDYNSFPGLLRLSKSYNGSRDAGGIHSEYKSLSTILNNRSVSPIESFLTKSLTDNTLQSSSFSYWIDEPTMTHPGTIHYKSNAGLSITQLSDTLRFGTSETNILSLSGSYNGVAYNMTDMNFKSIGFNLDGSGNTIINSTEVINSWSNSLGDVFQTANIINDINAIASQFSGDFTITIPGSTNKYNIAQPISLIVMSGNTLSPISGIYNIMSVSHVIASTFVTTLKLQRLTLSSANQTAASQGIFVSGTNKYPQSALSPTSNIKSPYKIEFGELYPTFEHINSL